ncbi:MAG: SAM-dependent chlorinase/fluorinase [Leptospiraceae bacterium]|nr:SAM-dependent chlorinase/fluorinase [Leptospiraceae bacterium]MCP5497954.1 SAM-dependent chlorinase/fluorinase [Leptospiraceae bacterium]
MKNIITLITDFGTKDGYVGAMKGKILSINPKARIFDITHEISPQNIKEASYTLVRSTTQFPKNSVHVAVIDPGVGSSRNAIVLKSNNRWYIGPDNGVFTEIIKNFGIQKAYSIEKHTKWWDAHATFDGLALFSPVAAYLSIGISPKKMGVSISNILRLPENAVEVSEKGVIGEIILFDHFGNAITNISKNEIDLFLSKGINISCQESNFEFVNHYKEAKENSAVSLINSDNQLELSINCGSAKSTLNLKIGDKVVVTPQAIHKSV